MKEIIGITILDKRTPNDINNACINAIGVSIKEFYNTSVINLINNKLIVVEGKTIAFFTDEATTKAYQKTC